MKFNSNSINLRLNEFMEIGNIHFIKACTTALAFKDFKSV